MGPQHRRTRRSAALPQRLRPEHAAEHALRRSRVAVPLGDRARRSPRVFEDGAQRRDFVHVRDVAGANVAALDWTAEQGADTFRAFNVGSGHVHTIGEMAAALSRHAGGLEPVVTGEYRSGDVRHITASSERLRVELGWSPSVSFDAGMAEFASAPLRASV
nr:GDP-mannose 4,6-dehydratase [Frondihabitans sucicola]